MASNENWPWRNRTPSNQVVEHSNYYDSVPSYPARESKLNNTIINNVYDSHQGPVCGYAHLNRSQYSTITAKKPALIPRPKASPFPVPAPRPPEHYQTINI